MSASVRVPSRAPATPRNGPGNATASDPMAVEARTETTTASRGESGGRLSS